MAGGWGSAKNKIRIGVFWDSIEISGDGSQARITDARVTIDRGVNIDDSSNHLYWYGGAVPDGDDTNYNVDGSGEKRVKTIGNGTWVNLTYGSTTTASFGARFEGINYAGGDLTASKTITYPVRPYSKPAAPSGLGMSGSGNSRTFTWTNNGTTGAPVVKTIVRQSLNDGSYVDVASVDAPGATVTLSNLPGNSKLAFRFYAQNTAGDSATYAQSAVIYTMPNAPTLATATKLGDGSIDVGWQDNSAYETGFKVQDSANGVTWADVAASTTSRPWNHASPNNAITHRYRVAALGPGGLQSGWSNTTNIIQLLAKPNPPSNLGPTGARARSEAFTLTWAHNPTDSTPQTQRGIQYCTSTNGGTSWSAWATLASGASSAQSYAVAANTFATVLLEWQVRTKGQHADWSDWSASSFLTLTPRPLTTITQPESPLNSSRMVVELGYSDPAGYPQTSSTIRVFDDATDVQVLSQVQAGPVLVADFSAHPLPEGVYRIEAWTTSGSGLSSLLTTEEVTVEYLPPAPPEVVTTAWNAEAGSLSIGTSNTPGVGVTEIARNLATNPSFETTTAGTVEVRRNKAPVPQATTDWGGNYATGGAGTTTLATDARWMGGAACRMAFSAAPTSGDPFISPPVSPANGPMAVGETWVIAFRYALSGGGTVNNVWVGGTNAPVVTYGPNNTIDHGNGTFTRWRTATCTSLGAGDGTFRPYISIANAGITTSTVFLAGDLLAEKAASFYGYFDGAYSPDSDLAPAWVGTANNSQSTLVGAAVVGTGGGAGRAIVSSAQWSSTGTKSVRHIPTSSSNSTLLYVAGSASGMSGFGVTFEAGKTYTVLVKCRLAAPQTGVIDPNPRKISAIYGAGSQTTYYGDAAPNEAGVHELRYTFSLPVGTDRCIVALNGGSSVGNGDVWWDDLLIVEGTYAGEFFDGSNTPDASLDVAWVGAANNSTSTLKTRATVDTVSQSLYRVLPDGLREWVADVGPNDTILDETPVTAGQAYVLVAWSAEGAAAETPFYVDPDPEVLRWFYIWKPGRRARFRAAVQRKRSASLAVSVANYAGRPEATSTYGEAVTEGTDYNMTLLPQEGTDWGQVRRVVLTPGDAIVRSPDGLRFRAALTATDATDNGLLYQQAGIQLRHVGG